MHYLVRWDIELEAETPEEAAKLAQKIQRDPLSMATVYGVELVERVMPDNFTYRVDLLEEDN